VTHSLTLNYGLRWDRIEPWYEKYNQIATFEPGEQSVVFPGAPAGILYPTDPGVPRTLAPPGNRDFRSAHRLGVFAQRHRRRPARKNTRRSRQDQCPSELWNVLHRDRGAHDWRDECQRALWHHLHQPRAAAVLHTVCDGSERPESRPVFPGYARSVEHQVRVIPIPDINWAQFEPISGLPNYLTTNRIPYTEEYMLSLERGFGANTVLSVNYVGTQGHRLWCLRRPIPAIQRSVCS
jgi:hypothetical protein